MNHLLDTLVSRIEPLFDGPILDSGGLLHSALKLSEVRPFVKEDFPKGTRRYQIVGHEGLPWSDFMNYENTGMVQGTFLSAMCLKYKVTHDNAALDKARRTFQGIRKVYEMSQPIAAGFYCKPWGGRMQTETSSDQFIYSMTGLDDYYDLASTDEKRQIRSMMVAMASFWLEHHYDWNYYGRPLKWPQERFVAFMAFAVKYCGGHEFEEELKRLLASQENREGSPFASTRKERMFKDEAGRDCLVVYPESSLSTYLSFAPVLKLGTPSRRLVDICVDSFEVGKTAIAEDGTVYGDLIFDAATGEYREIPMEETVYNPDKSWIAIACLHGPYRKGGMQSTMFARFALCLSDILPSCNGVQVAEKILSSVGTQHLTWFEDPFGIFPMEIKWMSDVLSCDAAANWIWCYWKLRSL